MSASLDPTLRAKLLVEKHFYQRMRKLDGTPFPAQQCAAENDAIESNCSPCFSENDLIGPNDETRVELVK